MANTIHPIIPSGECPAGQHLCPTLAAGPTASRHPGIYTRFGKEFHRHCRATCGRSVRECLPSSGALATGAAAAVGNSLQPGVRNAPAPTATNQNYAVIYRKRTILCKRWSVSARVQAWPGATGIAASRALYSLRPLRDGWGSLKEYS